MNRLFSNLGIAFLLSLGFPALAAAPSPAAPAVTADLRGYGKVSARFGPGQAAFDCEDDAHADILMGKMLADLFWDAGGDVKQRTLTVSGTPVTIHAWPPYGVIAVARAGSRVLAVGADDDDALAARLRQYPGLLNGSPVFAPQKPYPRYLDHYDLRAFKAYTSAMSASHGLTLDSHWQFIKKFGLGGISFQTLAVVDQNPAPGVVDFVSTDYEMRKANEQEGVASIGLSTGGPVPLWIYNLMPEGMMQPSPTTLMGAWCGAGPVGAHYESWWLSPDLRATGSLLFMRESMERYRDNPALSAWHLYTGVPGAELAFHDRAGQFWDYSPTGVSAFRAWLRDVKKYDLKQLGIRWYGDAARFTSWDQVGIPDANGFFGNLDKSCMRLTDGWQWASARDGVATPPPPGDPKWIPVAMPPSQQQTMLPWGEAFYRIQFDGGAWAGLPHAWLSVNTLLRANHPVIAWLNGVKVAEFFETNNPLPFSIPLAGKLKPGANELILRVPRQNAETPGATEVREGKIFGPVFLTATQPEYYPFMGEQANARYVDLREWQAAGVLSSHRTMLDTALAIDPDHPFNLSGGGELINDIVELAEDYGTSVQNTGREASYFPWTTGVGLVGGFYGTSEESSTADPSQLTAELGWILLDGDSSHNLYRLIDDYEVEEQKSGWFTQNKRAIQCFGKYLRTMPQIAVFWSGRNSLLGDANLFRWDLGLGDLQENHFDSAYATEVELLKGLTGACPVMIDSGSGIMDDDVIRALRKYIENGGTFIADQRTGLHTGIRQNAQPLAALTGLISAPHGNGRLRFSPDALLFGAWADRAFDASGAGFTPAPADIAGPGDPPVALARWDDGSIAISLRHIGEGQIIQIGSDFWRDGGEKEKEFLNQLLGGVGVRRNADASVPAVWARRATTKNGLQNWLLTYNFENVACVADLRLGVDSEPAKVWDLLTRQPVRFTYADGFVTIPSVSFAPHAVHLYAVKRADLADGLPFWWSEKVRYWKRPPAETTDAVLAAKRRLAAPQTDSARATLPFNRWRFLADRAGSIGGSPQWLRSGFDDSAWKMIDTGPWNLLDPSLADWHGAGLYRATFDVPPAWKGRRLALTLFHWDQPIVHDQGEFFINGVKVADYKAHGWSQAYVYDVTSLLHDQNNVLAVRTQGGKALSGLCGNVWLAPERQFSGQIDLSGTWTVVGSDYHSATPAQLPGAPIGRYLKREFTLPQTWLGKTVFLHFEEDNQWLGSVVINGRPINSNESLHPFSPRVEINLSPYLEAGGNQIELWPYHTIPNINPSEVNPTEKMQVTAIRLGVVPASP